MTDTSNNKKAVHDFWDEASCGEEMYLHGKSKESYIQQAETRYTLEPYIIPFADVNEYSEKRVLEIGVGLGAEHQKFAEAGAEIYGVDLTKRALAHTAHRFNHFLLPARLMQADAERIPYKDNSFDCVYSWGVLHHSPDTRQAINEVYRVLKPGGVAKIMIYHAKSFVGYMLWIRYALLRMRFFTPLKTIYSNYLESPGTKAYSIDEAKTLFSKFEEIDLNVELTHADLLQSNAGQRHKGLLYSFAKMVWPRFLIKLFFKNHGLFLLIKAKKQL